MTFKNFSGEIYTTTIIREIYITMHHFKLLSKASLNGAIFYFDDVNLLHIMKDAHCRPAGYGKYFIHSSAMYIQHIYCMYLLSENFHILNIVEIQI